MAKAAPAPKRRPKAPTGRPVGRSTKLTAATARIVLASVRGGDFVETAAELAHVHKDTVYGWIEVGTRREWEAKKREPTAYESACSQFSDAYAHAEAEAEHEDVEGVRNAGLKPAVETTVTEVVERDPRGKIISKKTTTTTRHIPPDPKALQWHATRRWSRRWADRQKHELTGPDEGPIPVEVSIDKVMASLAKLRESEAEALPLNGQPALPPGKEATNGK